MTNSRSYINGWGIFRSGSSTVRSSYSKMSISMGRSTYLRFDKLQFTFLWRPNDRSMCWVICRSWRGVSSVSTPIKIERTIHFAFQNLCFYLPKGHLLPTKSIGFVDQKLTFREVKYYVLQWPYYQTVTILHFFRRHKTAFCVGVNTFQHNSALRVFSYSVFSFIGAAFHLLLQNYSLQFS